MTLTVDKILKELSFIKDKKYRCNGIVLSWYESPKEVRIAFKLGGFNFYSRVFACASLEIFEDLRKKLQEKFKTINITEEKTAAMRKKNLGVGVSAESQQTTGLQQNTNGFELTPADFLSKTGSYIESGVNSIVLTAAKVQRRSKTASPEMTLITFKGGNIAGIPSIMIVKEVDGPVEDVKGFFESYIKGSGKNITVSGPTGI